MTHERDIERLLDHWFTDGPSEAPDRVIDVVADRIGRQSQRPGWRLDWRNLRMHTTFKLATAFSAVAIIAIVGYNLLPVGSGLVGGPGSTPSPRPTPIPMPSGEAKLAAGTYALDLASSSDSGLPSTFPKMIVTLPDGWTTSEGHIWKESDGSTLMHVVPNAFLPTDKVYGQPCQWTGTEIDPGPTVDGLASTLATIPQRNATTPVAVTVDGHVGKYLEWSVPVDADFATCDKEDGEAKFQSWTGRWQQMPGQVDRLWILDIGGSRFVMDAWYAPGTTAADRAELTQIKDSVRFEP